MELFETKVRYEKVGDDGCAKKTSESYLVDAMSFAEAEARIVEEMKPFINGEFTVSAVKRNVISELFESEGAKWYSAKVALITLDEKSGQEKKTSSSIFVRADDFAKAYHNLCDGMKETMCDWELLSLSETAILDIYKRKDVEG